MTEPQLRIAYAATCNISAEEAAIETRRDRFSNVLIEEQLCYDGDASYNFPKSELLVRIDCEIECLQKLRAAVELSPA